MTSAVLYNGVLAQMICLEKIFQASWNFLYFLFQLGQFLPIVSVYLTPP
ncbi:Unknown protein sequence [Pseudomonas syringae pv. syringae]|nr:Unknown protein sequence [Pseudomonas syringae pv. syringae]